jgi:hypothetical protein
MPDIGTTMLYVHQVPNKDAAKRFTEFVAARTKRAKLDVVA